MPLGTIATIATIASAAASIGGTAYAATQDAPKLPNAASSSKKVAQATAMALPTQRQLSAAEQMGAGPIGQTKSLTRAEINAEIARLKKDNKDGQNKGQIQALQGIKKGEPTTKTGSKDFWGKGDTSKDVFTVYTDQGGNYVSKDLGTADFTGYGTADIEGELARRMADIQIGLGGKYGEDYARLARQNADLADPEGAKARALEADLIQKQIANPPPVSPLSGTLESQIGGQMRAGSGLDTMSRDLLDSAVAQANAARGGTTGAGQVAGSLTTGMEGAARRQAAMGKAQGFLSSGSTPEDISYRREQQNLANLGAFVGGRTPESQFANLSGAGQGAAPAYGGQALPQQPAGAGTAGSPYSVSSWQAQLNAQQGQANPWLAGLSSLLTATGTLASAKS